MVCPRVRVTGADYASCNGVYELMAEPAPWAPYRPRYKMKGSDRSDITTDLTITVSLIHRYLWWSQWHSYGWGIGPSEISDGFYHCSYGELLALPYCYF